MKQVLVTGATGLIGTRLCEVMTLIAQWKPRAFVHSTAAAARIARYPIDFVLGDLCEKESVQRAVEGCDAIIHLARGDSRVMTAGLENLLEAALKHRCKRFVHVSSVAVYGNHPPPESISEDARPDPGAMQYGIEKLKQERRVLKYGRLHDLPFVILRPPNVYGPFAHFTKDLLGKIRAGRMAIVDGGQNPCNLVYVDNLIEAILLALWKPAGVGETFFVTDFEAVSWKRCLDDHAALLGISLPLVSQDNLVSKPRERLIWDSMRLFPRILLSGELRGQARQVPLLKCVENALYNKFQRLSAETQQQLRLAVNGPLTFQKNGSVPRRFSSDDPLIAAQSRTVAHSSEKARRLLGYRAPVSYHEGMALSEAWLRYSRIL